MHLAWQALISRTFPFPFALISELCQIMKCFHLWDETVTPNIWDKRKSWPCILACWAWVLGTLFAKITVL